MMQLTESPYRDVNVWTNKEDYRVLRWRDICVRKAEERIELLRKKIVEEKYLGGTAQESLCQLANLMLKAKEERKVDRHKHLTLDEIPPDFFFYFAPVVDLVFELEDELIKKTYLLEREKASHNPHVFETEDMADPEIIAAEIAHLDPDRDSDG